MELLAQLAFQGKLLYDSKLPKLAAIPQPNFLVFRFFPYISSGFVSLSGIPGIPSSFDPEIFFNLNRSEWMGSR